MFSLDLMGPPEMCASDVFASHAWWAWAHAVLCMRACARAGAAMGACLRCARRNALRRIVVGVVQAVSSS